jgi:hypothetical protein
MTPDDLKRVARLIAVYRSTVDVMRHPIDNFDGWRRRCSELASLADEIDAMLPPSAILNPRAQ